MPEFQTNVHELATLLAVVATAAAAATIGCWLWSAVRQRKLALARDALLAATMLLLAATMFFNQQRPRRLEYNPGRTAIERLRREAPVTKATARVRPRQPDDDRQRREPEAAERDLFLETMMASHESR